MTDASPDALRVLIVDDEPLARQRLRDLLSDRSNVTVVGEADTGTDAIAALRKHRPDLLFLDVQMPNGSGLDVVEAVGPEHMPVTVFVTAYDQYALEAFDAAATDYLLKPFDDERFEQAFRRARKQVETNALGDASEHLRQLLRATESSGDTSSSTEDYLQRIAVHLRGQVRIVPVDEITHITADGTYAELHTPDGTHIVRERMKTLEAKLDPAAFVRIHRSTIVRLDEVSTILRGGGGDYAVRLHDGTRLSVSRRRIDELEDRLDVKALNN
ncbi:LytR/AlgR family response regulator transcription factor [Salisaeta longa]|uniref:LytR/AlgR family response regulator transcription factor n=1 Tax=Salisaeta longa TaxID=503170 RepID=UPI0003B535E1|nr:LytTR family DNA-binding domain-containing protein [Salisaeta longa]